MIYEYFCEICERMFTEFRSVKERHNVFCCGRRATKIISLPNTHKDQAYRFTTEAINGKPTEIRSKGQFQRLLKENKIADASPKECFQQALKCRKSNEITREMQTRRRARMAVKKMQEANVVKEGKEILTKMCKKREGGSHGEG